MDRLFEKRSDSKRKGKRDDNGDDDGHNFEDKIGNVD